MKVLITGSAGMVGLHMVHWLREHHDHIVIDGLDMLANFGTPVHRFYAVDLRDASRVWRIVDETKPDIIFHFAAQSFVPLSYHAPEYTAACNKEGTRNLLAAVVMSGKPTRVIVASSSEVYGIVKESELPIVETTPQRPASPYARSKAHMERVCLEYTKGYKMDIVRARCFTHCGPGRTRHFHESAFAYQIAAHEAGLKDNVIEVGNLDSVRTYMDVRDACRAYWLMAEKCDSGEAYNVGGNTTQRVGQTLDMLLAMSDHKFEIVQKPHLLRHKDVTRQVPDCTKFKEKTGWEPAIPLEQTLSDLLNWHRGLLNGNRSRTD